MTKKNVKLPEITIKTENKLQNVEINLEEIIDVIKIIDPNKASGPDVISHKMLKICPYVLQFQSSPSEQINI